MKVLRQPGSMPRMLRTFLLVPGLLFVGFCVAQSTKDANQASPRSSDDYTFHIGPDLPDYSFHVQRGEDAAPTAIEVSSKGELVQTLEIPDDVDTPPSGMPQLAIEDVNGDGFADLKFLHWWGATGNRTFFYWLFDKSSAKFTYEPHLAELSNVTPSPATHEIKTHSDSGAAGNSFTDRVYRFDGNDLVLVREVKQEWSDEKQCFYNTVAELASTGMQVVHSGCVEVK
jgi:hypothetical protein